MGMDAKARLWYGTRTPSDAVIQALDEIENEGGEVQSLGVCIERVWCGDYVSGVGGTIAFSWWDEEKELALDELLAPVRVAVAAFLATHGDESECRVYLTADYS